MDIINCFKEECIQVGTRATDKQGLLREIAQLAKKSSSLDAISEDELFDALVARETIGSTGFEHGIAIPHCRLSQVTEFIVGLVIVPDGIDFNAFDGKSSKLLFFIIAPDSDRDLHIRLLSTISRTLTSKAVRKALIVTPQVSEAREIFLRHASGDIEKTATAKSIFYITLQQEEHLNDILQALAALSADVTVVEAHDIGSYLHRLPLFASFWNSEEKGYHLLIMGVLNKKLVNELVRNIDTIVGGLAENSGTMITVQDTLVSVGSLH